MIQVETIPVEVTPFDMSQVEQPGPTRRPSTPAGVRDDDDDDLPCMMSPPPLPFPRVFPGL